MKFGIYLVRHGIITAEQLVGALELQHRKYVPIGQLAIEERLMSTRDVFHVLHFQSGVSHRHERFGEIAVEMGLITQDELQRLLLLQMDRKPTLAEVLIRQGRLTREQAESAMFDFRRELDRHNVVTTRRLPMPAQQCGTLPTFPDEMGVEMEVASFAVVF